MPSAQSNGRSLEAGMVSLEKKELGTKWLSEMPTYSAWRNTALDCVDVLHWAANGMIAQLSGAEHPTVSHLHLSRVILLVPYREIVTLALFSISSAPTAWKCPNREEAVAAEEEVLRWAQQDEVCFPHLSFAAAYVS